MFRVKGAGEDLRISYVSAVWVCVFTKHLTLGLGFGAVLRLVSRKALYRILRESSSPSLQFLLYVCTWIG